MLQRILSKKRKRKEQKKKIRKERELKKDRISIVGMEKRIQKFSQASIDKIKGNHLKDVSLLSRSGRNSNLNGLLSNQQEREKLLQSIVHANNIEVKEHGLRKLREIIISVFKSQKNDPSFINLIKYCYQLTYDLFLEEKKYNQIGGIVFPFLIDNVPELAYTMGFVELYIIYLSHWEMNVLKSIDILKQYKMVLSKQEYQHLLRMALIFCQEVEPPNVWFQLLNFYKGNKLILDFLNETKIVQKVQFKCLTICQKSYNQLSFDVFQQLWIQNMPLDIAVERKARESFLFEKLSNGSEIIHFKKRPTS